MSNKQELIQEIREMDQSIKAKEQKIKTLNEDLKEKIDNTDAGEKVGRLRDQLKIAQEELIAELKRNGEVNDLMEEIGAEKDTLKGMKMTMSDHLVAYFAQTQDRQVQMDEEGHARDVMLSAKLSKEEKQYQESLFNQEREE